jgi:hypothetical protein
MGGGGGRGGYSAFFLALSPCDFFGRLWLWSLVDLCPVESMSGKVSHCEWTEDATICVQEGFSSTYLGVLLQQRLVDVKLVV